MHRLTDCVYAHDLAILFMSVVELSFSAAYVLLTTGSVIINVLTTTVTFMCTVIISGHRFDTTNLTRFSKKNTPPLVPFLLELAHLGYLYVSLVKVSLCFSVLCK